MITIQSYFNGTIQLTYFIDLLYRCSLKAPLCSLDAPLKAALLPLLTKKGDLIFESRTERIIG